MAIQKAGKVNYTTCKLQTSEDTTMKAVCFSPEKASPLKKAMESKSPIKVRRFEYNEKFNNIVIKKSTSVTDYNKPLPFAPAESLTTPLSDISTIKTTSANQLVCVKAMVKHLSGSKLVKLETGSVRNCSCILQDQSGAIKGVFWEEWIDSVEDGKTYIFTNMRVKKDNYTNEIFVNTAKHGCMIKECDPFDELLPDVSPAITDMVTKQVIVSIIGVKTVSKYNSCNACGKKIEGAGRTVKCESQSCKVIQKVSADNTSWYARLFVQNAETKEKFYVVAFNSQLHKILEMNDMELSPNDNEETVTETLLDSGDITITYNVGDGKIIDVLTSLV
jgi:hypothetical protein